MRIFRNREDSLKFGMSFFFIIGSILGTLFCNFMTDDMKLGLTAVEHEIITTSSLTSLDFTTLLVRVLSKRVWILLLFFLISMTTVSLPITMAGCGYFGFSTATLLCTLTMSYGAKGLIQYLAMMFPQYLMYVPAMYVLLWWMPAYERRLTLLSAALLVALVFFGSCLETLVNPWFLALFKF